MYRNQGSTRYGNIMPYDYANWGYIILYLCVILGSLIGNSLFLAVIKKNRNLRRSHHIMLATLAVRDLIVTVLVIPFVIDSQAVNQMKWNSGEVMCKLFSFLNYGTMSAHSFLLVFLLLFLYFWYRKQESYMTGDGQTVVRKTRMHTWAVPLAWVIGLGLAIPAGALSGHVLNQNTGVRSCALWDGYGHRSNGYKAAVANVFVAFVVPLTVLLFPLIALVMQLCGAREPRLDPPHSRNAMTACALAVVFVASRAPYEVYELMKLFHQSALGFKANPVWGTPYASWTFETDIILNCLIYVACVVHPIIYFAFNPDYRAGLVVVWKSFADSQSTAEQRARMAEAKRLNKRQYNSNAAPIIRPNSRNLGPQHEPLLRNVQPQIMPAGPVVHHPQNVANIQVQNHNILFPEHHQNDNSFDRMSPQLPAVFEYNGLKYIDTARVEPRIAYSPEKTPPKTPETPHFSHTPFIPPTVDGTVVINPNTVWPQPTDPLPPGIEPIATSERIEGRPVSFELQNLDGSPGNTLRDRNRRNFASGGFSPPTSPVGDDLEMLAESPGGRNRRRQIQEHKTNGNTASGGSRPMSPNSIQDNVEIVITGRTRSRQDLCPEVPNSKFEHAV